MSDNTVLPTGSGGDTVRTIDRGTAKTQVLVVDVGGESGPESLVTSSNPLPVSGSVSVSNLPATQPISATALPLPTGAATQTTLASILTAIGSPIQETGGTVSVGNFPATQPVSGTVAVSGTVPVSGTFFQTTQPVSGTVTAAQTTAANLNATVVGTGTFAVQAAQATAANLNATVVQATAANLNATVTGTITAVTTVTNPVKIEGNAGGVVDAVITAATAPANGIAILAVNETTPPSLTTGQSVAAQCDYGGQIFVKPFRRSLTKAATGTIASGTAATMLAAQAAGIFSDLAGLVLGVDPTTAVAGLSVNISDGTATYKFWFDIGTVPSTTVQNNIPPICINFDPPIAATSAATAWTIALSVADATVYYVANFVLQKAS